MNNFNCHFKRSINILRLVSLLIFFSSCRFIEEKRLLNEARLWTQHVEDSIRVADSLKRIHFNTKKVEEINNDTLDKSDKQRPPLFVGEIRDTYYIIVGSFANSKNAGLTAVKYHNLGFKTNIISTTTRNGTKTEMVSVNNFKNHNEAVRFLRGFQSRFDAKAWIYPNH